jgi:hypothetical protein
MFVNMADLFSQLSGMGGGYVDDSKVVFSTGNERKKFPLLIIHFLPGPGV